MKTKKILFLCTGNSCRSQIAEGIARNIFNSSYNIESAGTEKHGVNPNAIKTLIEIGIDINESISSNLSLRDELMIEYHDNLARFGFDRPAFVRSLITDEYRFTMYKNENFGELYHLKDDPWETTNLYEDPKYRDIKSELTETLVNQMMENIDKSPAPKRLA